MVRGVNLSNLAIETTAMKNFFVWKDVLYYDAFKRKRASDEIVVTKALLYELRIEATIEEIKEIVSGKLSIK